MALETFDLFVPRNAFSPRDAARAGDLWRVCQDAAVLGSTRRGWTPRRYREEACGFLVRRMAVRHHAPLTFGDSVAARTWVSSFLRGMITHREIRLAGANGPVASATQEWIFIALEGGQVRPVRAPESVTATFVVEDHGPSVVVPAASAPPGAATATFSFAAWFGWMDPLGHANHPQYVDWCDEALARALAPRCSAFDLVPVGEEVTFRSGVIAPERVTVHTALIGLDAAGDAVFAHRVLGEDGRLCATATLVRRAADGGGAALVDAFRAD